MTFPANDEARIEWVKSIAAAYFDEIEQVIRRMFPATPRRLASRIASACLEELSGNDREPSPVDLAALANALGGCKQSFTPRK